MGWKLCMNELQEGEKIYNNGFTGGKRTYQESLFVCKYLRSQGLGKIRIERAFVEFCKKQDEWFNEFAQYTFIHKVVYKSMKYKPYPIEQIVITENELEVIRKIEGWANQKFIFGLLVLAKLKNNQSQKWADDNGKNRNAFIYFKTDWFPQVKEISKVRMTHSKIMEMIHFQLVKKDLINFHDRYNKRKRKMQFFQELVFGEANGKPAIIIDDLDNCIDLYKPICPRCNNTIDKPSPKTDYCKECYKQIRKDAVRENVRKHRKNHEQISM